MTENMNTDEFVNNEEKKDLVGTVENSKTEKETLEAIEKIMSQVLEENKRRNKFMKYILGAVFIICAIMIYIIINMIFV